MGFRTHCRSHFKAGLLIGALVFPAFAQAAPSTYDTLHFANHYCQFFYSNGTVLGATFDTEQGVAMLPGGQAGMQKLDSVDLAVHCQGFTSKEARKADFSGIKTPVTIEIGAPKVRTTTDNLDFLTGVPEVKSLELINLPHLTDFSFGKGMKVDTVYRDGNPMTGATGSDAQQLPPADFSGVDFISLAQAHLDNLAPLAVSNTMTLMLPPGFTLGTRLAPDTTFCKGYGMTINAYNTRRLQQVLGAMAKKARKGDTRSINYGTIKSGMYPKSLFCQPG